MQRKVRERGWADERAPDYDQLADRCVALADGKTIACRLRPEARFHDDQPVTVDDVLYSVNRWLGNRGATLRQRHGLDELRTVEVGAPPGESGAWVRLGFSQRDPLVLERLAAINPRLVSATISGFGRTGRLFAGAAHGAAGDIVTFAKGLGNGFPIGACVATGPAATMSARERSGCVLNARWRS